MNSQLKKVIAVTIVLFILIQSTNSIDPCDPDECYLDGCINTDLFTDLKKDSSRNKLCICQTESMCITEEYHCVKPSIKAIRRSDTRECISECPSGSCLNKILLTCIPTSGDISSNANDGFCQCGTGCFNPYTSTCIATSTVVDSDSDGYCKCSDDYQCASGDSYPSCTEPAELSNGPNLSCTTGTICEEDSKCFNKVTKVCIEVTGELRKNADGSCECKVSFHCFDGANDTCSAPGLTKISENNHYNCKVGTACDDTTNTCFYSDGKDQICYEVADTNDLTATNGVACACTNPLHTFQANHQLKTEMKCVTPTSYPLKSTLKDYCESETFYSLLYGMYLPTLSDGEVNDNKSCRCKPGLKNVNNLDNSIFCGCPDNKYYDTVNNTCKTLKECHTAGLVVLDSYCVPCPGAPEFPLSTTEFNKCTCPNWRPNICPDVPVDGESTGLINYNGATIESSCQRNAISTNLYFNFDKTTTVRYDFPLTANMTIYIEGCRMFGREKITPKLYFNSVDLAANSDYRVANTNCGLEDASETIAFNVAQSGIYTLELECSDTTCKGYINIDIELPIESSSFSAELTTKKTQNAKRNSIIVGLSEDKDIFEDKYDHMFKGLKEGDVVTVHRFTQDSGNTSESFVRIRNAAGNYQTNSLIGNKQIYRYVITYPDDYVLHIGCELDTDCTEIQYNVTVDKLEQKNLRKVHQETFELTYTREDVPTNDATVNVAYVDANEEYLFKSMNIFDNIIIKVTGRNPKVRVFVKDFNANYQDLEVTPYKDVRNIQGLTSIYAVVVRIPGDYKIQFGCKEQSFPCTANAVITVRRTLVQYIQGTLEYDYDETYAHTILGIESDQENYMKLAEKLINTTDIENPFSFNLYSFMFPTSSTKENNVIFLNLYGDYDGSENSLNIDYTDAMPLYNLETVFNAKDTIDESLVGTRPSSFKLEFKCYYFSEICHYNYYVVRYIPPTPAGYEPSNKKCMFCPPKKINVNNRCKSCNQIYNEKTGADPADDLYRVPGTNNCPNYKNYVFNTLTKAYDCNLSNGYTTASCVCTGANIEEVKNLDSVVTMCMNLSSPSFTNYYEVYNGAVSPKLVVPKLIVDTNPPHTLGYQVICYLAHDTIKDTHIIGHSNFDTIAEAKKFFLKITNNNIVIDSGVQTFSNLLQDLYDGFDESKAVCVLRRITEDIDEETVPRQEYLSKELNYYYIPSSYGPHAFGGASLYNHIDYIPLSYGGSDPASFYIFEAKYFNEYLVSHVDVDDQTNYWSYWGPYFRYAPSPSIMITDNYYIINRIKRGSDYIVHSSSIKTADAIADTGNGLNENISKDNILNFINGTFNTSLLDQCVISGNNYYVLIGSKNCSLDGSDYLVCLPDPASTTTSDAAPQNLEVVNFCKTSEGAEWLVLSPPPPPTG